MLLDTMIEPRHTKMNQKMYLMEKDEGDLMPFSVRSVEDGTAGKADNASSVDFGVDFAGIFADMFGSDASLSVITSVAWAALLTTTIF